MKRDWDLIREQLLAIEEGKDFKREILASVPEEPRWEDGITEVQFNEAMRAYRKAEERILGHLQLLIENGFIAGVQIAQGASGDYGYSYSHPRLTMAGHDLLDTMRSRTLWEKVKSTAKEKSVELTLEAVKVFAASALKALV